MKKFLTSSIKIYVILLVIGIGGVFFAVQECRYEAVENIVLSISCSIIAAVIVAIIVDSAATRTKRLKDNQRFVLQSKKLREECEYFPYNICITVCDHCKEQRTKQKTFEEWCEELFNLKQKVGIETEKQEIQYCVETIKTIREACATLQVTALNDFLDNENYNLEFIDRLKKLKNISERIARELKIGKYDNCKLLILSEFKPCVIDVFPELESSYNMIGAENYMDEEDNTK